MCIFRTVPIAQFKYHEDWIYLGCQYIRVDGFFFNLKNYYYEFVHRINIELEEIFLFRIWILLRSEQIDRCLEGI